MSFYSHNKGYISGTRSLFSAECQVPILLKNQSVMTCKWNIYVIFIFFNKHKAMNFPLSLLQKMIESCYLTFAHNKHTHTNSPRQTLRLKYFIVDSSLANT